MRFYRLSESRVKRIVRYPARVEEGIAPDTIACMQRNDSKKRNALRRARGKQEEIWVMYQTKSQNSRLRQGFGGQAKFKSQKCSSKFKINSDKTHYEQDFMSGGYGPKIIVISAWRYPGVSQKGEPIPIPEDILNDLRSMDNPGSMNTDFK
ncbi:MAG: hypothetical protein HY813_00640 [Candidatus Portnoybacteria bacterium]|nr:hypothetical protein [Candidatus Portnoybacteria bacterium]